MASKQGVCWYIASRSKTPGLWNLRFTVRPGEAVDPLDVGVTEINGISKEQCQAEHDLMESFGYEMKSELRAFLAI